MSSIIDEAAPASLLEERDAFLDGPSIDAKKAATIGLRESSVAFGNIRGDRQCCAIELIDEETVAPGNFSVC